MTGLQGALQGQEQTDLFGPPPPPQKVWVGRSWDVGLGAVSLQGPGLPQWVRESMCLSWGSSGLMAIRSERGRTLLVQGGPVGGPPAQRGSERLWEGGMGEGLGVEPHRPVY